MSATQLLNPPTEVLQQWRRQVGQGFRDAARRGPRPFAVISYQNRGPIVSQRIELRRLTFVALFDEQCESGQIVTRFIVAKGTFDGSGLRFGGIDLSRFDKNLRLRLVAFGRGRRFDTGNAAFLSLALQMDRYLERCARYPYFPRRRSPALPSPFVGLEGGPATYVDLTAVPKRQVIAIDRPSVGLCGCVGSTVFDFYHTRFHVAP